MSGGSQIAGSNDPRGQVFQAFDPGTSQALAVGATSAACTALGTNTTIVRLFSTVDCFIKIGASPTAVANTSMFLPGGFIEYYDIPYDSAPQIAAISASGSGTLYITEGA
jgi:hypothetical protein